MLELNSVVKRFGAVSSTQRMVLNHLSLSVKEGERIAIVGPSGSGKSTLLNLIGAMDQPTEGRIRFNGRELSEAGARELDKFRNRYIGFVFQMHHLLPQCTLLENVLLPTLPLGISSQEQMVRAEPLLKKLGIWELRGQFPSTLSGGECQRTAVARAMINQPKLILADEPTGALDARNAHVLVDALLNVQEEKQQALIVVTHSMEVAQRMDKIYQLQNGKLLLM